MTFTKTFSIRGASRMVPHTRERNRNIRHAIIVLLSRAVLRALCFEQRADVTEGVLRLLLHRQPDQVLRDAAVSKGDCTGRAKIDRTSGLEMPVQTSTESIPPRLAKRTSVSSLSPTKIVFFGSKPSLCVV